MPINPKYLAKFEEGSFYHVYNHAVGTEKLFYTQENYRYFLQKLDEHLGDYIDVYAYCLLGNHFHLLIYVKPIVQLSLTIQTEVARFDTLNDCIVQKFSSFFKGYAQAINHQQGRMGALFCKKFRRIAVTNEMYFTRLIYYIHTNPVKHQITTDFTTYFWSSYGRILNDKPSKLKKQAVLDWFYGKDKFITAHLQEPDDLYDISECFLE